MTRCPFALWYPGPTDKVNPWPRIGKGAVLHSAEGSLGAALARLEDDALPAPGQPDLRVSWHFTVALDGTILQHYELEAQTWHATATGNPYYVGIEHEGSVATGPETDAQVQSDIRLCRWIASVDGWPAFTRDGDGRTLWEHNQLFATACPSGRIRWPDILKELNMPTPDVNATIAALVSAAQFVRMNWNLGDLSDGDKAAIRWVAQEIENTPTLAAVPEIPDLSPAPPPDPTPPQDWSGDA